MSLFFYAENPANTGFSGNLGERGAPVRSVHSKHYMNIMFT